MKVKTNHVPEDCDYLTNGREYQVYHFDEVYGYILDDDYDETCIRIDECQHLDGKDWEIVES